MIEYIDNHFVWCKETTKDMGNVYAEIELLNAKDVDLASEHIIGQDEIRRFTKKMLVDTGSRYLCINENIQQVLQLPKLRSEKMLLANDNPIMCPFVGPLEIRFKNRIVTCAKAIVLPGSAEPLLGLLPIEEMDVIIDPNIRELQINPASPDYPRNRL